MLFHLCRIRQILLYLGDPTFQLLVFSLVVSQIDYCNSLYYGLSDTSLNNLYIVFNSAAHLVSHTPRFSPTSLFLPHLLPLKYRVIFKICLMFKIKNKVSPVYLTNSIRIPIKSGQRSSFFNPNFVYRVKHFFNKRFFSHSGLFLWNWNFFTIFSYFD